MRSLLLLIVLAPAVASASWKEVRGKPGEWFRSDEAKAVAANVLAWQTEKGDWPKTDTFDTAPQPGESKPEGTFDNDATVDEIRFLARMFNATGEESYRDAALKAIDHIIDAQYLTGGFPQKSPPGDKYPRYITFNDGTTVNLLRLLHEVQNEDVFAFAGEGRRGVAGRMVDAGIHCILACQHQNRYGLTAWAAQYDPETLEPRPARSFEPASLAAAESAEILLFLMSLENPSDGIILSVEAGVNWMWLVRQKGIRVVVSDEDVKIAPDPAATPVWARFYDLTAMRPVFAGRDGVVKRSLAEIEQERRVGYDWYGEWGHKVFSSYAKWPHRRRSEGEAREPGAAPHDGELPDADR